MNGELFTGASAALGIVARTGIGQVPRTKDTRILRCNAAKLSHKSLGDNQCKKLVRPGTTGLVYIADSSDTSLVVNEIL